MDSDAKPTAEQWAIARFVDMKNREARQVPVSRRIAIVSTGRSGSSLFCSSLESTGLFGEPHEWFNTRIIGAYAKVWQLPDVHMGNYLNHVIERTTSANGVFSVNFHVHQLDYWAQNKLDLMSLKFDRVIYIYRRDKVAQAFSRAKALRTDRWQTTLAGKGTVAPEEIGPLVVLDQMKSLAEADLRFTRQYAGAITARFAYEDFASDAEVYRQALGACGIDCPTATRFSTPFGIMRTAADERQVDAIKAYLTGSDPQSVR